MTGKTILHYRILEKLGEGGMGVVYKAKDLKLNRPVALKFLHPESMQNKAKKASLLQEAQAAAAINHPNICTVYEIAETKSSPGKSGRKNLFFVMEYVEGQNLKKKIQSGPLKIDNAIDIAIQIAEGLQEIHDNGMVHRDIKSDNIRITKRGQVKIMDFGLIKTSGIKDKVQQNDSTGGTLAYMSPEQIRGEEVDNRSDIWSWGIVLYELISGQLPFKTDKDGIAVIYSILDEKPEPIQNIFPDIPSGCLSILNRSLEKDSENRYQSMKDVLADLKRLKDDIIRIDHTKESEQTIAEPASLYTRLKNTLIISGAVVLTLLILIFVIKLVFQKFKPTPESQVSVLTSYTGSERMPALSPDGNKLAFIWGGDSAGTYDIYIKLIGENDYFRFTSSKGWIFDYGPTWSNDGNSIAYIRGYIKGRESGIYSKSIIGGREILLVPLDSLLFTDEVYPGIDWSWDGQWLVYNDFDTIEKKHCLFRLNFKTRDKEQLTFPGSDYLGDMMPKYSPDGKYVAFVRVQSIGIGELYLVKLKNRQIRQLTFDGKNIHDLAWLPNNREIVFSSDRDGSLSLWRISSRGGKPESLSIGGDAEEMSISRTGNRMVYSAGSWDFDIWQADLSTIPGGIIEPYKFIVSSKIDRFGSFSPDGERIAFSSSRSGNQEIWTCNSDGSSPERITYLNSASSVPRWSPDGQWIVFDSKTHGHSDIMIVDANGIKPSQYLTDDPSDDRLPSWSHDGQWVYFVSNRTGQYEIFKIQMQGAEGSEIVKITSDGGFMCFESPDGKYIYYKKYEGYLSPIYRLDLEKSEETIVIDEEIDLSRWIVAAEGIYYIVSNPKGDPILKLYRYSTATIEQVGFIREWHLRLSDISKNGKAMLLWKMISSHDIYMVENFK